MRCKPGVLRKWIVALTASDGCLTCAAKMRGKPKEVAYAYARRHTRIAPHVQRRVHRHDLDYAVVRMAPDALARMIERWGGNMSMVARRLGVSRQRVHQLARRAAR